MIVPLLLSLLLVQEPTGKVDAIDPAKPLSVGNLGQEIDRSLHWLHGRFDAAQGSFGGLEADAWALLAFAESPRKYRPSEGPFLARPLANLLAAQKADGSFPPAVPAVTVLRALEAAQDDGAAPAAEKLRHALGVVPGRDEFASEEAATARAKELLVARHADGSWGSVLDTAKTLAELDRCHAFLKAKEPKKPPHEATALPSFDAASRAQVEKALARGAEYLLGQLVDGGWGSEKHRDAGITGMALGGMLSVPAPRPAPVEKASQAALDWLLSLQKADGSIHEGQLANYVTSSCVLALAKAARPADRPAIGRARAFLQALQADEKEGYTPKDRYYGGVGYGDDERPDLSNLQMALEAMHDSGLPASDPTFQKALTFLQRCQNRSESNDLALVSEGKSYTSGNDGGACYAPGDSKAGFVTLADGRKAPRSYGSMSYALLKAYLFAGLAKDDARVQSVWQWVRANYTLDVNPGFQASDDPSASYQGLFYYFTTMAKALDLYGDERILDAEGKEHDWRSELCGRLVAMQRPDGSWLNENASRWYEGNPVLATAYAMVTLGTALPAAK